MNLLLQRKPSSADHMHGDLFDNKGNWLAYTLEDEKRKVKVPGETAIPAGTYEIKLRPMGESRLDKPYSERFDFYKGQLWLQDVPNFTWVYVHCGNNDDHTDGCPLIGLERFGSSIGRSRDAYKKVYPLILEAMDKGAEVFIHVKDT